MITRRSMLGWSLGLLPLWGDVVFGGSEAPANDEYADVLMGDRWIAEWMLVRKIDDAGLVKTPNGVMSLGRFADPVYYMNSVIGWNPKGGQIGKYLPVRVPVGFVTDFASIPRVFWSVLRPDGIYTYAAVIHDYLYWEQYLSREESDQIFKFAMEDFRVSTPEMNSIYSAVRLGGQSAWDQNARLKSMGEKRILKRTPSDPTIRWSSWKLLPEVFK